MNINRRIVRIVTVIYLSLCLFFGYADTIYLKDGSRIEGEIKKDSKDEVVIDIPVKGFDGIYESKVMKKTDIEKIEEEMNLPTPKPVEQSQDTGGKALYKGRWVTPEEKDRLEKEVESQLEREKEFNRIRRALSEHRIVVGMTKGQVQTVMGKPNDIETFTYQNQIGEKWIYKTGGAEQSVYYKQYGSLRQYTQKTPEEVYLTVTFLEDKVTEIKGNEQ